MGEYTYDSFLEEILQTFACIAYEGFDFCESVFSVFSMRPRAFRCC